ncbi:type VI secretion system protein ImpL [Natronocella acetinitrilica]|uniref:Type VI secretion system protein ImpL n=1 Tax=Natronocella acetinitrilica TaxID=414046 RepID=A0AAE3G1H4_9GAMM|nr:type VI secretion system protein ImpL [Natronocella acetinitrilica]
MKKVFAAVTQRWFLGLLGIILLSVLIWLFGPYLALGPMVPFESVVSRAITIALLVLVWGGLTFLRWRRSRRAGEQLGAAIVASASPGDGQNDELRQRFEEAIGFLKQSGQGKNLYQLPWYVIVGPPGSGKTTALIHSGLNFPLDQKYGRDALRGVGGTRNCDWWFTDEAVLLDTAGRYFTQDSDAASDAAEWNSFLDLICKYRKRRPINGVLVTLSAADLLTTSDEGRRHHAATVRKRIDELQRQLQVQVPVYFLVTKCDLIAGFIEFFDDLGHEGRAQVWGMTRPEPIAGGSPAHWLAEQYDALLTRLDARLLERMDQEREPQRRARLFGFPRQMAGLKDNLISFVRDTFEGSGYDRPVMLRGLYFTSGTQEGTPIDRMMDSISRAYGMRVSADVGGTAAAGQGRSYFIHRLLKNVVFPESGLAGVNWRLEVGRAVAQNVAYLALLGVLGVLVAAWFTSYQYNRGYLADVGESLNVHADMATRPVPGDAGLGDVLPRLDALSEVAAEADRYRGNVPFLMGLGLYRGDAVGDAARQAYLQGVRELLVPRVVLLLEQRVGSANTPATEVYAYLKGYLMLADTSRLEREELDAIVRAALLNEFADQRAIAQSLAAHFSAYSDSARSFPAVEVDETLVARARSSLQQASLPALMLRRLEVVYDQRHRDALRLDLQAGLGGDMVFRRRSGVPLSEPVPALYTSAGFQRITGDVGGALVEQFMEDRWVFGEDTLPSGRTARLNLAAAFVEHYELAYIRYWQELLADLELSPLLGVDQAIDLLAAITGPTSPLRRLMSTVDAQTHFPEPEDDEAQPGGRIGALLGLVDQVRSDDGGPRPGARINDHFQQFHQYVASDNGAAPLDGLIALLDQLYDELSAFGSGFGDQDAMTLLGRDGGDTLRRLRTEAARTPAPFDGWLEALAGSGQEVALRNLRNQINQRYRSAVLPVCEELTSGRYPFDAGSSRDIAPSDFARLFGPGGVIEEFFNENLASLVDTSGGRWQWRSGQASALGIPRSVLDQFQRARLIQELFFGGANGPATSFELTPRYLDARARQFQLSMGEQSLVYRHGPPLAERFAWAGQGASTTVAFEDRGGQRPNVGYSGGWSWLRAIEAAEPAAESDTAYLANFNVGGYSARVSVEFDSSRNPLRNAEWRRFRCVGSL